jgi:7-cyano-7-deazaguanine reductase
MTRRLTHLRKKPTPSRDRAIEPRALLETFDNPQPARDYRIELAFPEFTSLCPITGQPDFATITIDYIPDKLCIEMKSLKLYFFAHRNRGAFYEAVVNTILDDLVAKLAPRTITVTGKFNPRGGMTGIVTATHNKK